VSLEQELARSAPWLQAALDRDAAHSLEDVRAEILSGKSLLWPGRVSAAVTEQCRDLHVWLAGGDLRELRSMEQAASQWGRLNGFDRMTISGRRGWERVLTGYRTMLVKDL
jgi:hypothetical protein